MYITLMTAYGQSAGINYKFGGTVANTIVCTVQGFYVFQLQTYHEIFQWLSAYYSLFQKSLTFSLTLGCSPRNSAFPKYCWSLNR